MAAGGVLYAFRLSEARESMVEGQLRRVANARLCTRRLQGRPPILQLQLEVDDVFQPLFFLVHI